MLSRGVSSCSGNTAHGGRSKRQLRAGRKSTFSTTTSATTRSWRHCRVSAMAPCFSSTLVLVLALACWLAPATISSFSLPDRHLVSARSELVAADSIGRDTFGDDDDDLRTVGLAFAGDQENDSRGRYYTDALDDDTIQQQEGAPSPYGAANYARVLRNELYLLEDKDYPKSLFEDYQRRVGQVTGITTLPSNDVAILHRSNRQWTRDTFNDTSMRVSASNPQDDLIRNDTILIIDRENGNSVASFGANLFYLPHSIAADSAGNLWVSDVGRHQVMRLPSSSIRQALLQQEQEQGDARKVSKASHHGTKKSRRPPPPPQQRQIWPDIILGEAFVPGDDEGHFCKPSEIAISSNGLLVFVADGYCNQRVMVFTGAGKYLTSFGQQHNMTVIHSLALIEERNLICVADRENGRILCYHAGLDGDLSRLGELIRYVDYPLGRVYAITSLSEDHLLVSSNQVGTSRYDLAILNPFTNELKLVWISTDLLEPHSLASTRDRQAAYAADISKDAYKKVFKFNIITRRN